MKTLILLWMMVVGAGAQTAKPNDEILRGVRFEAHKHHVRWFVLCNDYGSGPEYTAYAEDLSQPKFATTIESGAKDSWYARGSTAMEATYNLYLLLANNRPANLPADVKYIPKCDGVVLDGDDPTKHPCSSPKGAKP